MVDLRTARRIARLSMKQLADKAGIDIATVSRLESDRTQRPSYETIVRIARVLNLAPDELYPVPPLPGDAPAAPLVDEEPAP